MTSPKEDQQPMTTREESVARAQAFVDRKYVTRADARQKEMGLAYVEAERQDLAREIARFCSSEVERLASRQEVSVEELARVIDPIAFGIKPSMYGLRSQQELERHVFVSGVRGVARDKARALLAEYSITKRTTEG